MGTKVLNYSAIVAEGKNSDDDKSNSGFNLAILIMISLSIAIALFVTPALISQLFKSRISANL